MRIELEITASSARRAAVVGATLLLVGTAAVAIAVPITFSDGNVLTAAQLNQNFTNVENRLAALEQNDVQDRVVALQIQPGSPVSVVARGISGPAPTLTGLNGGDLDVIFPEGTFSAAPVCTAATVGLGISVSSYSMQVVDADRVTVRCYYNNGGSQANAACGTIPFNLICVGPTS